MCKRRWKPGTLWLLAPPTTSIWGSDQIPAIDSKGIYLATAMYFHWAISSFSSVLTSRDKHMKYEHCKSLFPCTSSELESHECFSGGHYTMRRYRLEFSLWLGECIFLTDSYGSHNSYLPIYCCQASAVSILCAFLNSEFQILFGLDAMSHIQRHPHIHYNWSSIYPWFKTTVPVKHLLMVKIIGKWVCSVSVSSVDRSI